MPVVPRVDYQPHHLHGLLVAHPAEDRSKAPLMFTMKEAAAILGISERRLYQLRAEYEFPTRKFGTSIIVTQEEIDILKQRQTRRGRKSRYYRREVEPDE